MLNGKQRIYKVLEDADGRARRFVIPKKILGLTDANFDPGQVATVKSFTRSVTLSLLNSHQTLSSIYSCRKKIPRCLCIPPQQQSLSQMKLSEELMMSSKQTTIVYMTLVV